MLNNTTSQNIANQAAMQAAQRGSSANVGLMARNAAKVGAGVQQQAAGQGAQLQAQQSQNAINSMGNIANAQVGQQAAALQGLNQYSLQQQGNLLGMQGNINSGNAALAGGLQKGQGNMLGNLMNGAGAGMNLLKGGGGSEPTTDLGAAGEIESGGSGFGDIVGGAGDAGGLVDAGEGVSMLAARGGMVPHMAEGGDPIVQSNSVSADNAQGPKSFVGKYFQDSPMAAPESGGGGSGGGAGGMLGGLMGGAGGMMGGMPGGGGSNPLGGVGKFLTDDLKFQNMGMGMGGKMNNAGLGMLGFAHGGKVDALVSAEERYLKPKDAKAVAKGKKDVFKASEKIPGKAKYKGNDYRNDVIPKKLDEGGVVIPNEILQGPNPHWNAMRFVHAVMKKNKK